MSQRDTLRDELFALLRKFPGELFKTNEISKMLGVKSDSDRYQELRDLIRELEDEGSIERGSRRRYGLPRVQHSEIQGVLRMHSTGSGVVTPTKEFDIGDSVLVRPQHLGTAMDGDSVRVTLHATKEGERPVGEVVEILQKAGHKVAGVVERNRHGYFVRPESGKMRRDIIVTRKDLQGAKEGDHVILEVYDWVDEYRSPEGRVLEILDTKNSSAYSNEVIATEYDLPTEFPASVLKEANKFSEEIPQSEIDKRLDLREETIFTIDPEDAKDFDDAVSLVQNDDGSVTLGVHIADVSHYVQEGSALDEEALARGTSVYLVGGVIPMLPERLSNGLCSLRPDEDKLAYSVFMRMNPETGEVYDSEFRKTVIRSVMRFSYEEAEERTKTGKGKYAKLLRDMRKLSLVLYKKRHEEGSIDFESDEYRFRFDENGNPTESYKKERLGSMRMIEDFMLAANRAVAEYVTRNAKMDRELPFIYRIHADPDPAKLRDLALLAKTLGYKLQTENPNPKSIQKFLDSVKGTAEEHLLNQLMLRAMAKAVYAEHNVGHFGLAFLHYTHFTSPIRRYPDLIVHRMLFEYQRPGGMNRERQHHYYEILPEIADQTSALERRATEAERESIKLAQIHLMRDKIGEEFDAIISGVTHFGMFVQLPGGAEGLIHVRELPGHYVFDEAHYSLVETIGRMSRHPDMQRRFRIGDKVRVQLVKIFEEKRQLDFRLAEPEGRSAIDEGFVETPERSQFKPPRPDRRLGFQESGRSGARPKKRTSTGAVTGLKKKSTRPGAKSAGGPPRKGRPPKRRSR